MAFARGGAEVAAGAPFDDPGAEPGLLEGGGCQAGLGDAVGSLGCQDAGAVAAELDRDGPGRLRHECGPLDLVEAALEVDDGLGE